MKDSSDNVVTALVIPSEIDKIPVTAIADNFAITYDLHGPNTFESVIIPSGVKSIGNAAFSKCFGLKEIYLPDSLVSLGDSVFYGCDKLKSVEIKKGVTSIGDYAFYDCSQYQKV